MSEPAVAPAAWAPRDTCERCRRPVLVCYCAHLPSLPARTRVVLLQHPRERRTAIGTARMAHLSLPGSLLRGGVTFHGDAVTQAALVDRPTYVLFPGPTAVDPRSLPADVPITLVVLDGTWSQAKKLLSSNPQLAALPRLGFAPERPSEYRIRKQPAEFCVSTIEALAEVLGVLEGRSFDALLQPFRAMIDRQIWFVEEVHESRHARLHPLPRPARRPSLPRRIRAEWARLVCVYGESNAWPRRDADRAAPETVHWLAHRPSTGETFEAIVAPREALAPATPYHVGLDEATLRAGGTVDAWQRAFGGFLRPDDLLVQWGCFYTNLATREGLPLPDTRIDLRGEVLQLRDRHERRTIGTLEACAVELGAAPVPLGRPGRGGERLALLVGIVQALLRMAPPVSA